MMNQSQFLVITCNSLKAREKSRLHGGIGFGFASHWLKNWRDSFKLISKRSNRNHVITFDSHLKTALKHLKEILLSTLMHTAIIIGYSVFCFCFLFLLYFHHGIHALVVTG